MKFLKKIKIAAATLLFTAGTAISIQVFLITLLAEKSFGENTILTEKFIVEEKMVLRKHQGMRLRHILNHQGMFKEQYSVEIGKLTEFFQKHGVSFPEKSWISIKWNSLFMYNSKDNHIRLQRAMAYLNMLPLQLNVKASLVQVSGKAREMLSKGKISLKKYKFMNRSQKKIISSVSSISQSGQTVMLTNQNRTFLEDKKANRLGAYLKSASNIDPDGTHVQLQFHWKYNGKRLNGANRNSKKLMQFKCQSENRLQLKDGDTVIFEVKDTNAKSRQVQIRYLLVLTINLIDLNGNKIIDLKEEYKEQKLL